MRRRDQADSRRLPAARILAGREPFPKRLKIFKQTRDIDGLVLRREGRKLFDSRHEQPARPHSIPISQVVEGYRNLNQSLQKSFLAACGLQPGFLKRLVARKEFPLVKQIDSVEQKLLLVSGQWRGASWCGVAGPRAGTPARNEEGIETAGLAAASLTPPTEDSCESRKAPVPSGRKPRACRRYCGGGSLRSAR